MSQHVQIEMLRRGNECDIERLDQLKMDKRFVADVYYCLNSPIPFGLYTYSGSCNKTLKQFELFLKRVKHLAQYS